MLVSRDPEHVGAKRIIEIDSRLELAQMRQSVEPDVLNKLVESSSESKCPFIELLEEQWQVFEDSQQGLPDLGFGECVGWLHLALQNKNFDSRLGKHHPAPKTTGRNIS